MSTYVLEAVELCKAYRRRVSAFGRESVTALDGVSLQLARHETLGIVGESGSGKSTLGRVLIGLTPADSGTILLNGQPVPTRGRAALAGFRREVQMVFQDPYSSLDPKHRIGYTLAEPLVVQRIGTSLTRQARVRWLLDQVGLSERLLDRYPYELSGGQRQRVAIARALATEPAVVICDEAVSALDVSTQAQVVNLLRDLQDQLGIALIFISHDISIVRNISHRIGVMNRGCLVEVGDAEQIVTAPKHPYTRSLLNSLPGRGALAPVHLGEPIDAAPSPTP